MKRNIFFFAFVTIFATACTKVSAEVPKIFSAKVDSLHQIGKYSGAEKLIRATKGEVGAVVFGPYVSLEPGRYSATFDVTANAPTAGVSFGSVDVSVVSLIKYNNKPITIPLNSAPSTQKVAVEFSVTSRDAKYEFRV